MTPGYISDVDTMQVLCHAGVIEEGDTLSQRFGHYMYLQTERGEHTTDGFRKLRVIHSPRSSINMMHFIRMQITHNINVAIEQEYMSSSKFVAIAKEVTGYARLKNHKMKYGFGTQGPSQILEQDGSLTDLVRCFYVKTWPKEAESWFTRQTHWPDRKLKNQIRQIGYLLVPTGNSNSQDSDLEWRCSFSLAEIVLFQSLTKFQRCTFIMLKVLLKEYLPTDINTVGKKQLLSTYHIKTLFLWSLENSRLVWEPEHMLDIIEHLLDELSGWINQQYFPHYFIPSMNLLDIRWLHGRANSLFCIISALRNDLSNKIKKSHFFMGQESNDMLASMFVRDVRQLWYLHIHHNIMNLLTGRLQFLMHADIFVKMKSLGHHNLSHPLLIEGLISIKSDIDPQMHNLYIAMYNDPIHYKLLTEVVPGLIDQYRGCIHLAKYCMAARDGRELPGVLHTAESLLKDTLEFDPCSGHVKLACLYIVFGDFGQAMDRLLAAENNFLFIYRRMITSSLLASQVQVDRLESSTVVFHEVFQKWAEGKVTSSIVVTWPEYITSPDLIQFEMIHEGTQQVIDLPNSCVPGKMVKLDCDLQWPRLSMIKLLKFVCAFRSGQASKRHMEHLVTDLIISSLSLTVLQGINCIYTVFNMAAWCYVKIEKYKHAAHMMTVAIGTNPEVMNRCAFSHHFVAHVIAQCII